MGKAIYLLVFWVILSTSSFYILYGQGNLFAGVLSDFVYFFFVHFIWARQSICWCFEWFCLLLLFTFYMGKRISLLVSCFCLLLNVERTERYICVCVLCIYSCVLLSPSVILSRSVQTHVYIIAESDNLFADVSSDFVYFFFLHFIWARQSICWCFEWFCLLLLFTLYMGKAIYLLVFWVILSTSSFYTFYAQGNLLTDVVSIISTYSFYSIAF